MAENRDYVSVATAYAKQAVRDRKGKRFCKWVQLAAKRHLNDLKRKRWPYEFDEWHANDVCGFVERLPHVEGVWDTATITLEPPQIFMLTVIFGWRRKSDGGRRFTSVYIEMARKGAKSTLTAAVALYCFVCEGEVGPQIIIGATTGEQAGKVFEPAKRMVERAPGFADYFGLKVWARSIESKQNGGFIQPINARGKTQDGWNPHMGVLDELHAHLTRALFDVIKSAFGSRKNPLLWVITTAGFDTNGVCFEQRIYVTKILKRVIEAEHAFGIIFTLDEGDDPFDESNWIKANPMLGITPSMDWMRSEAKDALASPAAEGGFKTKNLNIWMNAASAWLNYEQWKKCGDAGLDWPAFEGLEVHIGADLADKDDITAVAVAAIDADGRLICKTRFWLPEAVLDHPDHAEGRGPAPYRTWIRQGHLETTPGDWVDHNEIEAWIRELIEVHSVRKVTFDQFAAAQAMASRLNEDLATPDRPIAAILHKSAKNVTDPAKELEARVKAGPGKLRHDANPVMDWMASNVVVSRRRDETILPIKETEMSPNKIDGIDALVNAMAPIVFPGESEGPSVYETRGLLVL